ncbi:MAG: tetratricopeptide repeat protein [Desulfobacterales bacterium]|nr:tetratricopeptide repeat protein [Desulfobacterales bacterium]MDJ0888472.1 tetratricopeptide repeat protein [Desulfobacterales bacterium]
MLPRRNTAVFFALSVALLALLMMAACTPDTRYLREGHRYADAGDWDKAVTFFQKANEDNPGDTEISLMLRRSKFKASQMHLNRGRSYLDQGLFTEAMEEFQISMALNPANMPASELFTIAQNKRDARHHYKQGRNFLKVKKYGNALEAFQKAVELDPDFEPANQALSYWESEEKKAAIDRPGFKSDAPVSFKFKNTPIVNVFEVLTKLSGINFIFDREMPNSKVTLFMTDVSFDRFIDVLLRTNKLNSILVNDNTMIIYPDTPQKAKEYEDLQIKTFYLSNLEPKKAVGLLAKILKSRDIIANENLNAVLIRGNREVIEIASRIIEAHDGKPAEVLLDVEFLEVTQELQENLGLVFSENITFGLGETSDSISEDTDTVDNLSLYSLRRITDKELILSTPQATLNLLKQDGDTRILAAPKIRVKNAEQASILLGERVPLQSNRRVDSNTGDVTFDFQYFDVGVKLDAQPVINMHDEVTLKMTLEVSAIGQNINTPENPQFPIRTRTAQSVLTLRDSETVILGGLIDNTERKAIRKIPLLGDFPAMGSLFANRDQQDTKRDVLMVITPFVVRSQDIPAIDATEIWSGSANRWSVETPYEIKSAKDKRFRNRPREGILDDLPAETPFTGKPEPEKLPRALVPMPESEEPAPATSEPVAKVIPDIRERASYGTDWPENAAYSIHVGSYLDRKEAEKRAQQLSGMNYQCFMISAQIPRKGLFHRIYIGAYEAKSKAEDECNRFRGRKEFPRDIHVVDRQWAVGS